MSNLNVAPAVIAPLPRPEWLSRQAWPFESFSLEGEGCRIAVTDVGRGPVLLFVHTGFWSFIWRDVMLRLQEDFRCVCFDAPGTGRSDRLPVRSISLQKAARALTAVVQTFHLSEITLVFHDLGGPSGIAGAARVADRISGLCAVNTFAWKPEGRKFRGMLALMGSAFMREFSAYSGMLARLTASPFGIGLHMDDAGRAAFLAGNGRDGIRAFHSYMRDARHSAIYQEVDAALSGRFRYLPAITIFGERNDPLGFQPRWRALFPGMEQVIVPEGNHFPMCDAPDLVAGAIRRWHRERVALESPLAGAFPGRGQK
jgi:haloalkane dehalogenase